MNRVSTFPIARRRKRGYDVDEVDEFLSRARAAYDGVPGVALRASEIRHTAFPLRRKGYQTQAVDAALERLEDAFAARERELALLEVGDPEYRARTKELADEIEARLRRDDKQRFSRVSVFSDGYRMRDVDAFARRILAYLETGDGLTVTDARAVVFAPQRGGYREAQVDMLIDALVDVMLAIR